MKLLRQEKCLEMLMNLQVFSAIILLSVSFLIVSFVRDNKIYAVCAIGNLVVYLIAFAIDQELSIGNIVIHYQDLYYYVMLIIGYMILAKCIRKNDYKWKRICYRVKEYQIQEAFCSKLQTTDHQSSDHKKIAFYRN